MSVPDRRLEAARKVGKYLATEEGRELLHRGGRAKAIVPADWEDSVGDVLERVYQNTPPVTLAILRGREIVILDVIPADPSQVDIERDGDGASPRATIGMIYDAVRRSEHSEITFRIGEWNAAHASSVTVDPDTLPA